MKQLLILLFILSFLVKGNAQDSAPTLDYKNFGLSWFPVHSYALDQQIASNRKAGKVLKNNQAAYQVFSEARTMQRISWVALFAGMPLMYFADRQKSGSLAAWGLLAGSVACLGTTIILDYKATAKHRKAASIYNDKTVGSLETKEEIKLQFGVLSSGNVGLSVSR